MVCETYCQGDSIIHRLDPRWRIAVCLAFSVLVAVVQRLDVLGVALVLSASAAVAARLPVGPTLKRLAALNLFLLLLWLMLPLTTPGPAAMSIGRVDLSRDGLIRAAEITLKSNAIVVAMTALVSTIEMSALGHALRHLGVPAKLVHLMLLTVRYLDLLHHEYRRLATAMRVRGFRPRMTRHTYRSLGYLVGMLLVNSFDRSSRVLAAMKCRGFRGEFHVLDHFATSGRDVVFAAGSAAALVALGLLEWL